MRENNYFPNMLGTEEETRLSLCGYRDSSINIIRELEQSELNEINELIDPFCPSIGSGAAEQSDYFRENGSRTYVDAGGVELATPEVNNPLDLAVYIKADALLLERAIEQFTAKQSLVNNSEMATVFNRRVIDQDNHTWGCHDNLSIQRTVDYGSLIADQSKPVSQLWLGFLSSRSFITGAMHIDDKGLYFSQKLTQTRNFNNYGYNGSMLRVNGDHGQRLEIRCNDINIQDSAIVNRVGGAALVLAASQTALGHKIVRSPLYHFNWPDSTSSWNVIPLNNNHELRLSADLNRNIDMQRFTISTILDDLEDHINQPIPATYRQIGEHILRFCDDVEAVALGKYDIDRLINRADWASKLYVVRESLRRNPKNRSLCDKTSKLYDMLYDQIKINAQPNGDITTTHGYGYKLADKSSFYAKRPDLVEKATKEPPKETRAIVRVRLAKQFGIKNTYCDWNSVTIIDDKKIRKSIPLFRFRV